MRSVLFNKNNRLKGNAKKEQGDSYHSTKAEDKIPIELIALFSQACNILSFRDRAGE
jgi:hypothetical protein